MDKNQIKKVTSLLSFSKEELFDTLSENEKKEIYAWCSTVYSNPLFSKIINEFYTVSVIKTIETLGDVNLSIENKGKILAIAGIKDLFNDYHQIHIQNVKKDDPMTKEEEQDII